jgi:hypothetical protein
VTDPIVLLILLGAFAALGGLVWLCDAVRS